MTAIYRKTGDTLHYTPSSATSAGTLVSVGNIVGITKFPIAANVTGTLTTVGLFDNVAKHGTSNALTDGQIVWMNPSDGKIYNAFAAGYLPCGYAVGAATATATTCTIFLVPMAQVTVMANQAASTVFTVAAAVTDLNALLTKLKTAGLMTADAA